MVQLQALSNTADLKNKVRKILFSPHRCFLIRFLVAVDRESYYMK